MIISLKKKIRFFAIISILQFPLFSNGFALLSHEAIIDATWEKSIVPLLKQKYPAATKEELQNAKAFVYGGSLIADIGYFPFGSLQFTNLVHYVRSGDLITNVINEAQNLNEYAFAIGMLCHYVADEYGHSTGTNLAVPILFPKLKEKFGDTVSYELAHTAHARAEFGFDVLQTAKGNYSPESQIKFIGFEVSEPVLERAFLKTYGMKLNEVFKSFSFAINSFRFSVKQLFPELTRDAWKLRRSVITEANPLADKASYTKKIKNKSYNKGVVPQIKSNLITIIIGIIPKIGPFKKLKFKEPIDKVEKIFEQSFENILTNYNAALKKLRSDTIDLSNINYDTGHPSMQGEYRLADKSHYCLLNKHKSKQFREVDAQLKTNLLEYYSKPSTSSKNKLYKQRKTAKMVAALKSHH